MEDELASEADILLHSEKAFHNAAKRNDAGKMLELIRKGVDIKATNKVDRKALHWAAGAGGEDALRLLLEHDTELDDADSVVSLREEERKLQVALAELEMRVEEQQHLVEWLEAALERQQLDTDRRQQKEHERNIQLLLQQCRDQRDEGLAGRHRQYEGLIHNLSKELNLCKAANQELNNKIRDICGQGDQSKSGLDRVQCKAGGDGTKYTHDPDRVNKSREEMQELVNAPLPPTWRRSSLPTEDQHVMEDLRQRVACEVPPNRIVQPNININTAYSSGTGSLSLTKPRRESRRSSLNQGLIGPNVAIIIIVLSAVSFRGRHSESSAST